MVQQNDRVTAQTPEVGAESLPSLARLDRMTYNIIAFGFPLLTLTIITGAIWAQYAWGTYWQWDPKETASLVAWLIYAGYLHGRISRGWHGKPAAWFSILGFLAVLFCFAGVNLVGGMHAYGAPTSVADSTEKLRTVFDGLPKAEVYLTQAFIAANFLAMLSYFALMATKKPVVGKVASVIAWVGFFLLTAALGVRTEHIGRLPFTSGYDFTLWFTWAIAGSFLFSERWLRSRVLGAFVYPIVLLLLMYAYLFYDPSGQTSRNLMPALQNEFWLHVHVSVAILAYGALSLSLGTAIMYLLKHRSVNRAKAKAIAE